MSSDLKEHLKNLPKFCRLIPLGFEVPDTGEINPKAPEAGLIPVPSPIQSIPPWNDAVPLALTLPIISLVTVKNSKEPVPEADISPLEEIYPNEPVASIASIPPANEPVPLALNAPLISPLTAK